MQRAKDNKSALVDEDNGSTFFAEVEYLMNYIFFFFVIFRVFHGGRKEPPLCGQRLCSVGWRWWRLVRRRRSANSMIFLKKKIIVY